MTPEEAKALDDARFAAIEAAHEERQKTLTPEIKFEWQLQQEREAELDNERALWHRTAMKYTGLATHYEKALKEICEIYAWTSVAGESASRIAHKALGRAFQEKG